MEKNIFIAAVHAQSQHLDIDYQHRTAESVAESGQAYDVILNMEVVEHVADFAAFMQDCCRLVADTSVMFVATINRNPLSWLFAIVGAEYVLRWLPRGTHRWDWFRTPAETTEQLSKGGLSVVSRAGVAANPFNRRLRITKSMKVNYMLFASRS